MMPRRHYPGDSFRDGDSARIRTENQKYTEWAQRQQERGSYVTPPTQIKEPKMSKSIFCFGSNEAGIHGAGAAKIAYKEHGARWGFSYGHCGDSWAIPTKDMDIVTMPVERIAKYVQGFLAYAEGHPKLKFKVTRIGCGLAGLTDSQMACLFVKAPKNCSFDEAWRPIFERLNIEHNYWGTF